MQDKLIERAIKQKYGPQTAITSIAPNGEVFIEDAGVIRHLFVVCSEVPRGTVIQIFAQTHQVMVPK